MARFAAWPLVLLLGCGSAWAQSADQELLSATDSPDPVVPGANVTYTVQVRNNGPDAATNGGINVNLALALTHVSHVAPAGFACFVSGNNMSCTNPAFAAGTTATITIVAQVQPSLVSFPDGNFTSSFFPSGTTPDPNTANNHVSVVTSYDSPQIDMRIAVADSPDPVGPDQDVTYTIDVGNDGPDDATDAVFTAFNNGSLRFQSATVPAGFDCTLPAVGAAPTFNCTRPSYPSGASSQFVVVVRALREVLGINDGTVATFFGFSGTGNETDQSDNGETENTAYVTPDAELSVAVVDDPDPALLDDLVDFLVTVQNAGPDGATNARLNVFNNGTLRFASIMPPAGFSCATPAVGAAPAFTCTAATFASGATASFVVTLLAPEASIGPNGATVTTNFNVASDVSDPNASNNSETESTLVRPDRLLSDGFE